MGTRNRLIGTEVPITGSDSVRWTSLSVPSSASPVVAPPFAPPCRDFSAGFSVGDDNNSFFITRILKSSPHVLEIMEVCSYKEFPRIGLQIEFPDELSPFSFIFKNENPFASAKPYMLYALTVSGVAYLIRLKDTYAYTSRSVFQPDEIIECNVRSYRHCGTLTAVAATAGCLVVGGNDGSVGCLQLGMLDPSAPGFLHELRDDALGRLWGLVSRSRTAVAVQDMVTSKFQQKKLLFVLYSDGNLRVWDLLSGTKVFSHIMNASISTGSLFRRLWIGETINEENIIHLAVLHKSIAEVEMEMISLYRLHFSLVEKAAFLLEPFVCNISLDEGGLIDVKFYANNIFLLKENGLVMREISGPDTNGEVAEYYTSQEAFVADQLFQSSEHCADDLLWLVHSVYSSAKEQVVPYISSIFLRKLLLPGVYQNSVLRATLQDHNKRFTDSEFFSLTADDLKREITSVIELEGDSRSPLSVLYCWKNFCMQYFDNWCRNNAPCGLIVDSETGGICLIRTTSVSLFRSFEDIELLVFGSCDEVGEIINFSGDELEREVLLEVLRCTSNVNQQLGKAASSLLYESFISEPIVSSGDVVSRLLKILRTGYAPSVKAIHMSEMGVDTVREKELSDHKSLRKFSADMFVSLHGLHTKAATWDKVLDVILRYLKFLVPRKTSQNLDSETVFSISACITVQATCQISKVMFESALDILLLISYMAEISGQIHMSHDDVNRIQIELVPMIQEVITEWHIIHFLGTTPSGLPAMDDFSCRLSSLQIDSNIGRNSWNDKLGKCDFTLAFLLLLSGQSSSECESFFSIKYIPDPGRFVRSVQNFTSWIIWGGSGEESSSFFSHSTQVALILLRHGQWDAVEYILTIVDGHLRKEKTSETIQGANDEWCILLHLLGCSLLAQAHRGLCRSSVENNTSEALRCFFRAGSLQGAPRALKSLSSETGFPHLGFSDLLSTAAWKLHYYQWAMQLFERYNFSEGACHFAVAALEHVDDVFGSKDGLTEPDLVNESKVTVVGRLWANVFKFKLDLKNHFDAYCAITSNPDEESKYVCLRRFIIVLCERGATKVLCDGQLPFVDLAEKVVQELAWKAERSDVLVKPNPYKLLYAFEMHRHNWRKAANYIYRYSAQLKTEGATRDNQFRLHSLQERLNCLSAAINALQLVHPAHAWIDHLLLHKEASPTKKARFAMREESLDDQTPSQRPQHCLNVERLETEFLLTSAEYSLSLANVRWTFTGIEELPSGLVDLLVQTNLYDLAFMVLLKFSKGSVLKRELERVFVAMSLKCCPCGGSSLVKTDFRSQGLLLAPPRDEVVVHGKFDVVPPTQRHMLNGHWETLEVYLKKYICFHSRLPVIVAETLLCADPQIELPLWLVHLFKGVQKERSWGMAGSEASPASLFQLYVDYGRYAEATNLLLEFLDSFASMRPADIIRRKKTTAVWFPYTTIERLWCKLEESISLGHMIDHCEKLKKLLQNALFKHIILLKGDSDDVLSSLQRAKQSSSG